MQSGAIAFFSTTDITDTGSKYSALANHGRTVVMLAILESTMPKQW